MRSGPTGAAIRPGSIMFSRALTAATILVAFSSVSLPAFADDWIAAKLRGPVFTKVNGDWVQLHRGDVVPDRQAIRTLTAGRVTLVRGEESIALGPDTEIEIVDKDGQQFTTVKQSYGKVEIEAEVRNVKHFAVVNTHLAAVVKGTVFVVTSDDDGGKVSVRRGQVEVQDKVYSSIVEVPAGHWVATTGDAPLVLDSDGTTAGTNNNGVGNGDGDGSNAGGNGNGHGNGGGNSGNGNGNGGGNAGGKD
jgi:uncharacterized membrane protein YgcG